eukprot:9481767-Pyramimonas_sp.AAC.1
MIRSSGFRQSQRRARAGYSRRPMSKTAAPSYTPVFPACRRAESCRRMGQHWHAGLAVATGRARWRARSCIISCGLK